MRYSECGMYKPARLGEWAVLSREPLGSPSWMPGQTVRWEGGPTVKDPSLFESSLEPWSLNPWPFSLAAACPAANMPVWSVEYGSTSKTTTAFTEVCK